MVWDSYALDDRYDAMLYNKDALELRVAHITFMSIKFYVYDLSRIDVFALLLRLARRAYGPGYLQYVV